MLAGKEKVGDKVGPLPWVAMAVIFCVSLFASFFPTLSKRVSYLRIPPLLFFIGKHFGTGVILSTAFVHLLQDAFEALLNQEVKHYTGVGEWAGLIVLVSLLSIFLVEYVSTAYVDRLHSGAGPAHSHSHDAYTESYGHSHSHSHMPAEIISHSSPSLTPVQPTPHQPPATSARTALLAHSNSSSPYNTFPKDSRPHPAHEPSSYFTGHHRYEPPGAHDGHGRVLPRATPGGLSSFYGSMPSSSDVPATNRDQGRRGSELRGVREDDEGHEHSQEHDHDEVESGTTRQGGDDPVDPADLDEVLSRKRQVVSILILQLGIMLHSFVIGLTLSVTAGADFTSLLVAVCFHQLFEGLSLGIRIANLPLSHSHSHGPEAKHGGSHIRGHLLRPCLALLFSVTVPVGILTGLFTLRMHSIVTGPGLKLVQGIMAALSAGLLIYAATVEMLAADFVLAAGPEGLARAHPAKQALAIGSLLAGVAGMSIIGFWS